MTWNKNVKRVLTVSVLVLRSGSILVAWDPIPYIFFPLSLGIFYSESTLHILSYSSSACFHCYSESVKISFYFHHLLILFWLVQPLQRALSMGCVTQKWSVLLLGFGEGFDLFHDLLHLQSKLVCCLPIWWEGKKKYKPKPCMVYFIPLLDRENFASPYLADF